MPRDPKSTLRHVTVLPVHQPVEGTDFMPDGWCGGCEVCSAQSPGQVCGACSYEWDTGYPLRPISWPCAVVREMCPEFRRARDAARRYAELLVFHDFGGIEGPGRGAAIGHAFESFVSQLDFSPPHARLIRREYWYRHQQLLKALPVPPMVERLKVSL